MYFAAFSAAVQISGFPVASVSGWLSSKVERHSSSWGRLVSASIPPTSMALIRVEVANLRVFSIFKPASSHQLLRVTRSSIILSSFLCLITNTEVKI